MADGFQTRALGAAADAVAPDGSEVRLLAASGRGSMVHFRLAAGKVSRAVKHSGVQELWFFTAGEGEMWRKAGASRKRCW